MEFLKENRNVVTLIAVVVIAYLLLQTDVFQGLLMTLRMQWAGLSDLMKLVVALLVVYLVYNYMNGPQMY